MEAQFHRLQNRLGRPITSAEFKAIADDYHAASATGDVPDLVKEYGEQLEARQKAPAGSEDRHQLMVEEY